MTRRQLATRALLALFSMPLGKFDAFASTTVRPGGSLRVPLDQWAGIIIEYQGKQIGLSSAEIFGLVDEMVVDKQA